MTHLVRVPLDGQGALDRIRLCGQAAGYVSALPAQLSNLGAQAQQFSPLGVAEDVIRSNGRSRGGLRDCFNLPSKLRILRLDAVHRRALQNDDGDHAGGNGEESDVFCAHNPTMRPA